MATATKKSPSLSPHPSTAMPEDRIVLPGRPGLRRDLPVPGLAEAGGDQPGDAGGGRWPTPRSSRRGTARPPCRSGSTGARGSPSCSRSSGTNILCAALIRFPWKKRQTGFVITHAGLADAAGRLLVERQDRRRGAGRHARRADVKHELVRHDYPRGPDPQARPRHRRADSSPASTSCLPPRHLRLGAGAAQAAGRLRLDRSTCSPRAARRTRPRTC